MHDSSTETIELKQKQKPEMDSLDNNFCTNEITHSSVSEAIKRATESILRQVEEICALRAKKKEIETAGNSRATGFRRGITSAWLQATGLT